MAIQGDFSFKGVVIPGAYLKITRVSGGKVDGGWFGVVSVFANQELSKPRQVETKPEVLAVPAVPEIPATEEDLAIPGVAAVEYEPAEYRIIEPDPICQFQATVPYDAAELNPYALLYPVLKTHPDLTGAIDV